MWEVWNSEMLYIVGVFIMYCLCDCLLLCIFCDGIVYVKMWLFCGEFEVYFLIIVRMFWEVSLYYEGVYVEMND